MFNPGHGLYSGLACYKFNYFKFNFLKIFENSFDLWHPAILAVQEVLVDLVVPCHLKKVLNLSFYFYEI